MHDLDLIPTLASGLGVALVFGYITHRLGLSPIVGYLLAGIAVGPYTPGFVADRRIADELAEFGVVLLMFGVGLQFHLKELLNVRRVAIPGAIVQSVVATLLGTLVAKAFGWDWSAGIIFGLSISVASTVVLLRVLADNRDLHTAAGHIAVGWLVVEDLFTVVVLVLLPALFGAQNAPGQIVFALAVALFNVAILIAFTFVVGGRVIPWLLSKAAQSRSRELFTLTVLVLALGIAVGSARIFGVSMALGAFLAGMVVGQSEFSFRAASDALPMRDAFAVLFFVSVGLLLDPSHLITAPGLIAATLAVILIGKPLSALAIVLGLGYPLKTALSVSVALAQIGEFSFILATLGKALGILSTEAMNTLVAAAIVSISVNPLLYRAVDPLERWLKRGRFKHWFDANRRGWENQVDEPDDAESDEDAAISSRHRAIVVGYGPVGRTVTRLLRENDVEPTVIDLNLAAVQSLHEQGFAAIYGDAAQREILKSAGIARAGSLILSASNFSHAEPVIRLARELNPRIRVLARTAYLAEIAPLKKAGANNVFAGEGEVALAFTAAVLQELGATAEQIDRERARVNEELFGEIDAVAESVPLAIEPKNVADAQVTDGQNAEGVVENPTPAAAEPVDEGAEE